MPGPRKSNRSSIATEELIARISADPDTLSSLLSILNEKGTARYKAAKDLQLISRSNPVLLYPNFRVFTNLLESSSSILRWNAIIILSHLATVDTEGQFDAIFDTYFGHLWDGSLVTAANICENSGRIARCRPDIAENITQELLNADRIPLPTPECREVARGKVLTAFADYLDILKGNRAANDFILRCAGSRRPSVKKQAEVLMRKMNRKAINTSVPTGK